MHGFSRTVSAGRPRVAPSLPVVPMSPSSVCNFTVPLYVLSSHSGPICRSDDPQMPGLIPLIKKIRPEMPIIYRSHIEIRSDLVHVKGSPQEEVWQYLWNNIQHADLFISHPVNKFVPSDVPPEKLALLGAATDW